MSARKYVIKGIKIKLKYWKLGRSDAEGEVIIIGRNYSDVNQKIYNEFSKHLLSKNISFDSKCGNVYAGFNMVGKFSVEEKKEDKK